LSERECRLDTATAFVRVQASCRVGHDAFLVDFHNKLTNLETRRFCNTTGRDVHNLFAGEILYNNID
jgi:hypothetical protein